MNLKFIFDIKHFVVKIHQRLVLLDESSKGAYSENGHYSDNAENMAVMIRLLCKRESMKYSNDQSSADNIVVTMEITMLRIVSSLELFNRK